VVLLFNILSDFSHPCRWSIIQLVTDLPCQYSWIILIGYTRIDVHSIEYRVDVGFEIINYLSIHIKLLNILQSAPSRKGFSATMVVIPIIYKWNYYSKAS